MIARRLPGGLRLIVLLAYAAVAALLEVNLVFAAFLAGFGLVGGRSGTERRRFAEPLDAIQKVAVAVFIPMYFAMVGAQLDFGEGFSIGMLLAFLLGIVACSASARSRWPRGSRGSVGSRS